MASRLLAFLVCLSEQVMSNMLWLNFTPAVSSGAGNGMRERHRHWQGQGSDTKDSTCLFSQQMNIVHPSEPPAQTGYQSAAGCVSGWEMTCSLIFRHRDSCLHGGYTKGKLLTDVFRSWLNIPKAKVYYPPPPQISLGAGVNGEGTIDWIHATQVYTNLLAQQPVLAVCL